jgi:hypothetical protein
MERSPVTDTILHPMSGERIEFVQGQLRICTVRPSCLAVLPEEKLRAFDPVSDSLLGYESGRRGF